MTGELTPPEQTKLETLVGAKLQPGESVLGYFKENRKRLPFIQLFWPSRVGLNCAKLIADGEAYGKVTWMGIMWLCVLVVLLGVMIMMVVRDLHPGWTVMFALCAMIGGYLIMFRALSGRAFAVTNQRLICVSLPASSVVGAIDLKDLKSVDIVEERDGTTDVIVRLTNNPKMFPLRALGNPLEARDLIASLQRG